MAEDKKDVVRGDVQSVHKGAEKGRKHYKVYEPEEDYGFHLNIATFVTLLLFIILFWTVKVEVKAYKPKHEIEVMTEEVQTEVEQMQEEIPLPKPKLPVQVEEAEEGEEAQEDLSMLEEMQTADFDEFVPPPPEAESVYDFIAVEIKPQVIKRVEPEYPEVARRAGVEGNVYVLIIVDENGDVIDAQVVKSSNPIFDSAAVAAVRKWKFKPGYQRDKPVKVRVMQPIFFRLTK